jgi:hypothetical protein
MRSSDVPISTPAPSTEANTNQENSSQTAQPDAATNRNTASTVPFDVNGNIQKPDLTSKRPPEVAPSTTPKTSAPVVPTPPQQQSPNPVASPTRNDNDRDRDNSNLTREERQQIQEEKRKARLMQKQAAEERQRAERQRRRAEMMRRRQIYGQP